MASDEGKDVSIFFISILFGAIIYPTYYIRYLLILMSTPPYFSPTPIPVPFSSLGVPSCFIRAYCPSSPLHSVSVTNSTTVSFPSISFVLFLPPLYLLTPHVTGSFRPRTDSFHSHQFSIFHWCHVANNTLFTDTTYTFCSYRLVLR